MRNNQFNILTAVRNDQSKTGPTIDSGQWINTSIIAYFGGSDAAGTISLEVSNDAPPAGYQVNATSWAPTNWIALTNGSASVTSAGTVTLSFANYCYRWTRAVWTRASGGANPAGVNVQANVQGV